MRKIYLEQNVIYPRMYPKEPNQVEVIIRVSENVIKGGRIKWIVPSYITDHLKSDSAKLLAGKNWGEKKFDELINKRTKKPNEQLEREQLAAGIKPTFKQWVENSWLNYLKPGITNSTKTTYGQMYKSHLAIELDNFPLDQISGKVIHELRVKLEKKKTRRKPVKLLDPATVNQALNALGSILESAKRAEVIRDIPIIDKIPRKDRSPELDSSMYYSDDQYHSILDAAYKIDPIYYVAMLLAGDAGLRRGESCALNWDNVDWKNNKLKICKSEKSDGSIEGTKSKRTRYVPMSDALREALLTIPKKDRVGYVLKNPSKIVGSLDYIGRVNMPMINTWMGQVTLAAEGVEHSQHYHKLRHTFGSKLGHSGATVQQVCELMGHASIETTMIYMHDPKSEEAINLLNANAYVPPKKLRLV